MFNSRMGRAAVIAWLTLACGASEKNPNQGSGGKASGGEASASGAASGSTSSGASAGGSAGSSSGSGGGGTSSGGGLVLGDSLTDNCIRYAFASCKRQAECLGTSSACLQATLSCPDVVASPGSTRTSASLRACAEEYATYSCEKLRAGERPACVTPGERAVGEPCLYPSQCQTLACATADSCGMCNTPVPLGGDCANNAQCAGGLLCDETSHCNVHPAPTDPATTPFPTNGMSCAEARTCALPAYCELDGLTCRLPPSAGQACGVDGFTGQAAYCADGLVCHRTAKATGVCNPPPAVGAPCLTDPETGAPTYSCGAKAYCDTSKTPATCAAFAGPGGDCSGEVSGCQAGLQCFCTDADQPLTSTACVKRVCQSLRFGGQRCDAPGDRCHPGYSCTGGVCVGLESRGLFEAACSN